MWKVVFFFLGHFLPIIFLISKYCQNRYFSTFLKAKNYKKMHWSLFWLERREFGPLGGVRIPLRAFRALFLVVWGHS